MWIFPHNLEEIVDTLFTKKISQSIKKYHYVLPLFDHESQRVPIKGNQNT